MIFTNFEEFYKSFIDNQKARFNHFVAENIWAFFLTVSCTHSYSHSTTSWLNRGFFIKAQLNQFMIC